MENGNARTPHIAVLPTPGMGHLIPLAELAKRLVACHGVSLTFITFAASASKAQQAFLDALPSSISSVALPPVPLDDAPADARIETLLSLASVRSLPALRDVLRSLQKTTHLVAFAADLFAGDTFDVARELGIPPYLFFPSNYLMLALMFHLPDLDATTTCEYRDLPAPIALPGCVPLPGADLLHPLQDRTNPAYPWMVHHARRYREAEGIIINSYNAIEPATAEVFAESGPGRPPVYAVGPLVQSGPVNGVDGRECLEWLDEQLEASVLFISFGSGGTLSTAQMAELALGLEASGQRFLWVVRAPSDMDAGANYFDAAGKEDPLAYLPAGFLERTKGAGRVVPAWAPQIEVLAHAATGGFLSHCGWNSTQESVVHGVPMIAWPLYAEQRMNAVMLVEETRIALRPAAGADGLVGREEIARVVKALMEGEEGKALRGRVRQLQEDAAAALADGGSSARALSEVASKWKTSAAAAAATA